MRIKDQLMEVAMVHEGIDTIAAWRRSLEMLDAVSVADPNRIMNSFPHQLSGGQQQQGQLPITFGPPVLEVRKMQKYYEVRDTAFSGVFFKKVPRAFAYWKPRQLSRGQKQLIGIARAFGRRGGGGDCR
jgi:ABC-type glutathione transport system ATPase component